VNTRRRNYLSEGRRLAAEKRGVIFARHGRCPHKYHRPAPGAIPPGCAECNALPLGIVAGSVEIDISSSSDQGVKK
jgi:nitrite reductase/ring-hydroxylating ferredoxin subunit